MATIRNPVEWTLDQLRYAGHSVEETSRLVGGREEARVSAPPTVRQIEVADLREVLRRGVDDFMACRTDVILLCLLYPLLGLVFAQAIAGADMLPLIFPLVSGFTLVGPAAAIGLYEMSRRREKGLSANWADSFRVAASPRFGAIVALVLVLLVIFFAWLVAADAIYSVTLGPEQPTSVNQFLNDVFNTPAGWTMIVIGLAVGFVFALVVLAISIVSFPLLLDRDVGLPTAVATSLRAVAANPGPMAVWGLIVAASVAIGSIPLFLGLAVVIPILGHATWHLYRKIVV